MMKFAKLLNQEEFRLVLMAADKVLMVEISQIYLVPVEIYFQHFLVVLVSAMAQICKQRPQSDLKNLFMALN